ncbi:MAG: hypothetical protein ABIM99_04555 [Candidatus Dojkabacteria bacterium]
MAPYITLKIENHVPHLFYTNSDGTTKQLTTKDENISKLVMHMGESFNLTEKNMDDDVQVNRLILLSHEADPDYVTGAPEIDSESLEFELEELILELIAESRNIEKEYSDLDEMTQELRDEIDRNQNIDIMASILDTVYKIIIAKTLLAAYELEIGEVHLKTTENYPRFVEKLGEELLKLDIELIIDEN